MICDRCLTDGNISMTLTGHKGSFCPECHVIVWNEDIASRAATTERPSDFKDWKGGDLSQLFWVTFGKYVKEPTEEDYQLIKRIFHWACHANHALSNSISHAFKWARLDLYTEGNKWKKERKD